MSARLLTATEVAELLREDLSTIRRQTRRKEIPGAMNLGTTGRPKWRYDAKELDAWLKACRAA